MALSYQTGVDLAFDTGAMRSAAPEYESASEELTGLKTELDGLLATLTASGWTTEAGKKFAKMVEEDWSSNLVKYCDLISTLAQALRESADEYDRLIEEKVDALRLESAI